MADLEVKAETDLAKAIAGLRVHAEKMDALLPTIAEMLVGAVQDVFDAEGPGWEPLAEATKKRRRGSSYKILQDTGVMAASVDPRWGTGYAEAVGGASYTIFHVTGTEYMPKRNPFDLGPFEQPLLEEVAALLTEQVTS
jgi:phage gpG-like protein